MSSFHSFIMLKYVVFMLMAWNGIHQVSSQTPCVSQFGCSTPPQLTIADKRAWLNDHNVVRCQAGALTMPALIWDDALEKTAQEFVNTCPSGHNANRVSRYVFFSGQSSSMVQGVGENYAAGYSTPLDADAGWASEKPSMGGHYTQMVWANTRRVGCARNTVVCNINFGYVYVCDYYPPGNFVGQQPFTPGTPSSPVEACVQQARTNFPVMIWSGGFGTVVNQTTTSTNTPPTQASTTVPTTAIPTAAPTLPPTTAVPTTAPTTPSPTQTPTQAPTQAPTPVWQSFAGFDSYPGQNAATLQGASASSAQSFASSRSYPGFVLCSNTAYFRSSSRTSGLTTTSLYQNRVANAGCTLWIYAASGSLTN